jgi:NAD/NADP transhydrogenase alpha subunit
MRRSEFKDYIKETIVELLSEEEGRVSTDDPAQAAKLAKQGIDVDLTEDEGEEAVADPNDSVAKIADKLQKNAEKMLTVLDQWKKAEGKEKEELLDRLKALSKVKNDLEGLL